MRFMGGSNSASSSTASISQKTRIVFPLPVAPDTRNVAGWISGNIVDEKLSNTYLYPFSGRLPPWEGKGRAGSHERQKYVTTAQHSFLDQSQSDRRRCRDFRSSEVSMFGFDASSVAMIICRGVSAFFVWNDVSPIETIAATATFFSDALCLPKRRAHHTMT